DPLPPPEVSRDEDRRAQCLDLITELLDEAVANRKVRSVGWDSERDFAEDLLKFILGDPHKGSAVNIIAADAQHGRRRPDHCGYPGRDPMRINSVPGSTHSSVPGSTLGPQHPEAPASVPLPPGEGAEPGTTRSVVAAGEGLRD